MGDLLKEQDIHVESFTHQLNMRFAPPAGLKTHHGGIEELVELQKEFGVFKKGRRLSKSMADLYAEMSKAFDDGLVVSVEGRNAANTTPTTFETFVATTLAPALTAAARRASAG